MRNFLLTLLSVLTIFSISFFLPSIIAVHHEDQLLWTLFFTGFYMGMAIVLLKISYFIRHYIKGLLLIIVCGICHYGAVVLAIRIQSYIFKYVNKMVFDFDSSSMADPLNAEDYNVYAYSLANLIAISVLILCLSFILKFRKWYRLAIFGSSIIMTLAMNWYMEILSHHSFGDDRKGALIITSAFALWQCIVGTVIYKGIKDDEPMTSQAL